ncbi:MAG TPA: SusE domain-containing protein [Hanamia sp.]|nr:SusE domain-containing protein [Hanamia sp.]
MKYIFKTFVAGFLIFGLWSCRKDEHKVILEGGTAPVLTSSVTDTVPMSFATQNNTAFKLNWTNPDYQFNTGVNSLDVSYNILIDTTSDFSNPNLKTVSVGSDLSKTFTQAEFNDILLNQLQLDTGMSHKINIKVNAFLGTKSAQLSSNVLSVNATPYAIPPKVAPPASGELFIVGSATPGGWNNPMTVDPATQQFTKVSPTLFEITIQLTGNGEYKLIGVNGSWDQQWGVATADDPTEIYGGDFVFNSQNVLAPPTSGKYKITVDFQRGKFTVTPQ